jgi:hypothetical protein
MQGSLFLTTTLGIVYESKNLPEEASQMYTKALEINPSR